MEDFRIYVHLYYKKRKNGMGLKFSSVMSKTFLVDDLNVKICSLLEQLDKVDENEILHKGNYYESRYPMDTNLSIENFIKKYDIAVVRGNTQIKIYLLYSQAEHIFFCEKESYMNIKPAKR